MDRKTEATLVRKRVHQRRHTLVMHGSIEQLIRYVLTIPKPNRRQYKLVCGDSEYGSGRIEAFARELGIVVSDEKVAASKTATNLVENNKPKSGSLSE
jgi:hypothetical protein